MNKVMLFSFVFLFLVSCATEGRIYCEPEQREADVCITLYDPVCGDDGKTYSNSCGACKDEKVNYWVEGECPE